MNIQPSTNYNPDNLQPGIYRDVPNDVYHASKGISASRLTEFGMTSPHKFRHAKREQKDCYTEGTLLHHLAVEKLTGLPEGFALKPETYTNDKGEVKPWNGNAGICKEWATANADKVLVSQKMYDNIKYTDECLSKHTDAAALLNVDADRELTVVATHEAFDCLVRCKIDIPFDALRQVADLKSTRDATKQGFKRQATQLHYYAKAAFYFDTMRFAGLDPKTFWWIACEIGDFENQIPPEINIYWSHDDSQEMERGRDVYRGWLMDYLECEDSGIWPMSTNAPCMLELEPWAYKG